jgi:hypothetical protein
MLLARPNTDSLQRPVSRLERQKKPNVAFELASVVFVHFADTRFDKINDFLDIRAAFPNGLEAKPVNRVLDLRHWPLLQHR